MLRVSRWIRTWISDVTRQNDDFPFHRQLRYPDTRSTGSVCDTKIRVVRRTIKSHNATRDYLVGVITILTLQ